MSVDVFNEQIPKLYANLYEMSANIDFIQRELPRCHAPEEIARNISSVCHEFEGALHDVRKEVRTLEDKLGLHPGEEPFDPGVTNSDPRVTMTFIREWLLAEIERLHETVTQLQGDPSANAIHGSVYVLVSESATNILGLFSAIHDALEAIDAAVG